MSRRHNPIALKPHRPPSTDRVVCADCLRQFDTAGALAAHRKDTHENIAWMETRAARRQDNARNMRRGTPVCPKCGDLAKLSNGKFGVKAEHCGLWSWGYKPLVDRETHAMRIQAHAAFDPIWKSGSMSRGNAYAWLADHLGIAQDRIGPDCHISLFDAETCMRVIIVCDWWRGRVAA